VYGAETGAYHGDGDPGVIERFTLHDRDVYSKMRINADRILRVKSC